MKKKEIKQLGKAIHRMLNKTLDRKLTSKEYISLVLMISVLFDEVN